jgi:competence protein ComGC
VKRTRLNNSGFTVKELMFVLIIVSITVYILSPTIAKIAREKDRVECANNIRELGRALYIYAAEHDGQFPESIKELYEEEYISDERYTDCPSTRAIGSPENLEYDYLSGVTVKDPSLAPLLKDKNTNHPRGRNILQINGILLWDDNNPSQ